MFISRIWIFWFKSRLRQTWHVPSRTSWVLERRSHGHHTPDAPPEVEDDVGFTRPEWHAPHSLMRFCFTGCGTSAWCHCLISDVLAPRQCLLNPLSGTHQRHASALCHISNSNIPQFGEITDQFLNFGNLTFQSLFWKNYILSRPKIFRYYNWVPKVLEFCSCVPEVLIIGVWCLDFLIFSV